MSTSNCWCSCEVCHCGPNCQCTETLCRCHASSVLNSLGVRHPSLSHSRSNSTTTTENGDGSNGYSVKVSWNAPGLTTLNATTIETILSKSNHVQQVSIDVPSHTVQVLLEHARSDDQVIQELTSTLSTNGFVAKLEHVETIVPSGNSKMAKSQYGGSMFDEEAGIKSGEEDDLLASDTNSTNPTNTMNNSNNKNINNCTSSTSSLHKTEVESDKKLEILELVVGGMTCTMCSNAIISAISAMPDVKQVRVSLAENLVHVEYYVTPSCTSKILQDEIEDIGYIVQDVIAPQNETTTTNQRTVELTVTGMTCSMCTNAIQTALSNIGGIEEVSISLPQQSVRITYQDGSDCNPTIFQETIEDIGYEVQNVSNLDESRQTVDPEARLQRLLSQQEQHLRERKEAFLWSLVGTLPILVFTMIIPYVLPSSNIIRKALMKHVELFHHSFVLESLILLALATPVQFGSGYVFYKNFYYGAFVQGVLGMDVLVAIGITASYGYAGYATWIGSHEYHFFETSAVLICFVLLGKWLNAVAVRRTSEALTQLIKLQPKTALKVIHRKGDNTSWNPLEDPYDEEIVPIQRVYPGDIVKILKGSSIPVDGIVIHGEMSVDESMITGESIPVFKTHGSVVLGGTICAESGNVETTNGTAATFVQATGVGSSTALAQIVHLVQDAQSRQVPIQNFADTVSSVFVPTVVTISLFTFMIWYGLCNGGVIPPEWYEGESPATFSLMFSIACLVISCPCALGLATPTAVMVGTGVSARNGVLLKGGETLEMASQVDTIVFDKTGTLTLGKPALTDFVRIVPESFVVEGSTPKMTLTEENILWLLGSLERNSEHPLASPIVAYAEQRLATSALAAKAFAQPTNFRPITGRGATGLINGSINVSVGNRAFAAFMNLPISEKVEGSMQALEQAGKTAILAAVNGVICVVLGVADELKPDAFDSLAYLKKMGVDVWMLTGDNKRTANSIAQKLNLPSNRVIAEALPVSKVEKVRSLKAEGRVVAMIGDGVNDSPALAEAHVGISIGTGAEIAVEASDMVLVRGNVADVCTALHLCRVIFRRIKLNFLWALIYNCLGIPLAAGVFYPIMHVRLPPTVAAVAMALSSVSVVSSSLSLRFYKPPNLPSIQQNHETGSNTARSSLGLLRQSNEQSSQSVLDQAPLRRSGRRRLNVSSENDLTEPLLGEPPSISAAEEGDVEANLQD